MIPPHLHLDCRDAPFTGIKIQFHPFHLTQFTRANKQSGRKPESGLDDEGSGIGFNGAEQVAYFGRVSNGGEVLTAQWSQSAPQVGSRIAVSAACGDPIPENPPGSPEGAVCGFQSAPAFNAPDHG